MEPLAAAELDEADRGLGAVGPARCLPNQTRASRGAPSSWTMWTNAERVVARCRLIQRKSSVVRSSTHATAKSPRSNRSRQ